MVQNYSACHLAEAIYKDKDRIESYYSTSKQPICSYCGKECLIISGPTQVNNEIELGLRRWKDNDSNIDELFTLINDVLARSWRSGFTVSQSWLQREMNPKYKFNMVYGKWEEL